MWIENDSLIHVVGVKKNNLKTKHSACECCEISTHSQIIDGHLPNPAQSSRAPIQLGFLSSTQDPTSLPDCVFCPVGENPARSGFDLRLACLGDCCCVVFDTAFTHPTADGSSWPQQISVRLTADTHKHVIDVLLGARVCGKGSKNMKHSHYIISHYSHSCSGASRNFS